MGEYRNVNEQEAQTQLDMSKKTDHTPHSERFLTLNSSLSWMLQTTALLSVFSSKSCHIVIIWWTKTRPFRCHHSLFRHTFFLIFKIFFSTLIILPFFHHLSLSYINIFVFKHRITSRPRFLLSFYWVSCVIYLASYHASPLALIPYWLQLWRPRTQYSYLNGSRRLVAL